MNVVQDYQANKYCSRVAASFPCKLHRMLDDEGLVRSMISWQPSGNSFVIQQPEKLNESLLKRFLSPVSSVSHLKKELTAYGFEQHNQGPDKGGYYHSLFRRDQPSLAKLITRTSSTVSARAIKQSSKKSQLSNLFKEQVTRIIKSNESTQCEDQSFQSVSSLEDDTMVVSNNLLFAPPAEINTYVPSIMPLEDEIYEDDELYFNDSKPAIQLISDEEVEAQSFDDEFAPSEWTHGWLQIDNDFNDDDDFVPVQSINDFTAAFGSNYGIKSKLL